MKEIADSNVILSGLQADILKLETDKVRILKQRTDEIDVAINDFKRESKSLVDETENNYTHVHNFYEELKKFAAHVKVQRDEIEELLKDIEGSHVDFNNYIKREVSKISELKTKMVSEFQSLEDEREFIKSQRKSMEKERIQMKTQQAYIKTALNSLNKK